MSHGLLLWLENIDRRRNEVVPVHQKADRETLRACHTTLTVRLFHQQVWVSSLRLKSPLLTGSYSISQHKLSC